MKTTGGFYSNKSDTLTIRMNWDEAKCSFLKLLLLCARHFLPLGSGSVAAACSKHTALIGIGHLDNPKGSKINKLSRHSHSSLRENFRAILLQVQFPLC